MARNEPRHLGVSAWIRECASAVAGSACGFVIWLAAPTFVGRPEPWDGHYPFYTIASVLLGTATGLVPGSRVGGAWLGCCLGQCVAVSTLPGLDHSYAPVGFVFAGFGSVVYLVGLGGGYALRSVVRELGVGRPPPGRRR